MRLVAMLAVLLSCTLAVPAFAADEARARELVKSLGCKGCHQLDGAGGSIGPSLDGLGKRMDREQIRTELTEPKADDPKSSMPSYQSLSAADLQALVDFLAARR
jgi:ubiquinol-cytochrome c reductase cytochrome b subunit